MRNRLTFPLALALAVAGVAVACLADPDPRGGLTLTGPGDREAVPVPDGGGLAADGDDDPHKCTDDGDACPQNPLVIEVEGPCKGIGEVRDNVNGGCRCLGSLEYDGNGTCVHNGVRPNGGPGVGRGGRLPGLGGGGKKNNDNDDETEDDSTVLHVSLKCDATTVRGSVVTCKATTRNARGPVYEWLFAPKPERVKIRKGMSAPVLPKVEKENTHSSTWSGEAAAGGKVSVVVKDSTRFAHSHVTIEVTDGGHSTPVSLSEGAKLTNHLWPGNLLGKNANAAGDASIGQMMGGDGAAVYPVASGPNEGYHIVGYTSYSVHRYRQMNERILATGPKEIPDGDSTVRHWDYLKSFGYDPYELFIGTLRHEGYGGFIAGKKGHQGQIEKAITVEACGDAGAITARIVAPTFDEAQELRDLTEGIADTTFAMATLHNHVYGHHNNSPIAYWKPGKSPYTNFENDLYDSRDNFNFSSPGCDWSSF